uniref:Putative mif4g domain-containing protein n=1 Tax=Culex tarsalis TaxID=7177 RepID=A0A1Q3FMJ8_CULTA
MQEMYISPGISRERSFIRTSNQQVMDMNANKRRSLAFSQSQAMQHAQQQQQQLRDVRLDGLPGVNNKLNVHAQEFQMNHLNDGRIPLQSSRSLNIYSSSLQHSKSNVGGIPLNLHHARSGHGQMQLGNIGSPQRGPIMMSNHPMQHVGVQLQSSHMPLVNSPSSGNILHVSSGPRVKFAPEPMIHATTHASNSNSFQPQNSNTINSNNPQSSLNNNNTTNTNNANSNNNPMNVAPLQRSKSLSSADTLTRGLAGLGLAVGSEGNDIGQFPPEIQLIVNRAAEDPNTLNARCLMELATQLMHRAVDGRRYALPISRLCISIIAKEKKETFLEALLNTCRQWYQERDKVLGPLMNIKNPARPRFTAFMAFLTEMFCQLKRRQLQLRTECDGVPPPMVLLTVLGKCCEDCVKPPVRSLSEIECLFFVLTCIGRDLEMHLPQQLETLLAAVRDAFLNSSASAPAIRRTLLQLIELQASRWQLPGNTVLYYYPSSK